MDLSNNIHCEKRDFTLNREKALNKKFKIVEPFLDLKADGRCIVGILNLFDFENVSSSCVSLYTNFPSCAVTITNCVDKTQAVPEVKFNIQCDERRRNIT